MNYEQAWNLLKESLQSKRADKAREYNEPRAARSTSANGEIAILQGVLYKMQMIELDQEREAKEAKKVGKVASTSNKGIGVVSRHY